MPKRKAEDITTSAEQAGPSNAPQAESSGKYAYSIVEEQGAPYRKTETANMGMFNNAVEANKEAKAIAKYWDLYMDLVKDGQYKNHGTKDLDIKRGGSDDSGIQEWVTTKGELRITMNEGEGVYHRISVFRQRLQTRSKYEARQAKKLRKAQKQERKLRAQQEREDAERAAEIESHEPLTEEEWAQELAKAKEAGYFWYSRGTSGMGCWFPIGFDTSRLT